MIHNKYIQTILLSLIIFFYIYHYSIINPTFIDWCLNGDAGQHFIGWHFFRNEEWHFPIGKIENFHYPSGTTVVYTDSIPLFAIPLKLFSTLLPDSFQYQGLWMLLCYILMAVFSTLILSKYTKSKIIILFCTSFFLLSPLVVFRSTGHEALAAHWLILASIYLYLNEFDKKNLFKWFLLIIIASLIHFYLLVMVLFIWFPYLMKSFSDEVTKKRFINLIIYSTITLSFLLFIMWIVGYFTISVNDSLGGGYGIYSMNILSPFNPMGIQYPTFFFDKFTPATQEQYEGFNYLGLGMLMLLPLSIFYLYKHKSTILLKKHSILIIVLTFLVLFSLSNKITLSNYIVFEYNIYFFEKLGNLLRSSGRVFWIVYYFIMIFTFITLIKYLSHKKLFIVLFLSLIIQFIDFYPWYNNHNIHTREWSNPLTNPKWENISKNIDHIIMIPASSSMDKNYIFSKLASDNKLTLNVGYVAREDRKQKREYQRKLLKEFLSNKLNNRAMYIVTDKYFDKNKKIKDFLIEEIDGYNVIYPINTN